MKQLVQVAGGRKWHGEDHLLAQGETLEILQNGWSPYGPCVLQGCVVTANGGNVDISAGLMLIKHATDGWKIVRFAGVTNQAVPGYIFVDMSAQQKLYTISLVLDDTVHDYTARYVVGSPGGLPTNEYVLVSNNTDALVDIHNGFSNVNLTPWQVIAGATYSFKLRINKSARLLYFGGNIQVPFGGSISYNTLFTTLPAKYRPVNDQTFFANPPQPLNTTTNGMLNVLQPMTLYANGQVQATRINNAGAGGPILFGFNVVLFLD